MEARRERRELLLHRVADHDQLRARGRGGDDGGQRARGDVVPGDDARAAELGGRRARAVGGHAVQRLRAVVLDGEQHVVAVPDGGAGTEQGRALPVEGVGHRRRRARAHVDDVHLRVRGDRPHVLRVHRDAAAVGGERGLAVGEARAGAVGQRAHPAAVRGGEQDVGGHLEVGAGMVAHGGDGQRPRVRGPRGAGVVEAPGGDDVRVPVAVGGDDEHRAGPVDDPALAVEPGQEPVDAPGRAGPVVVALAVARRAFAGGEGDPGAVRGERHLVDRLVAPAHRAGLAGAVDGQDPQLRAHPRHGRRVREVASVGRPRRVGVGVGPRGQGHGRGAAVGPGQPDRAAVMVGREVDAGHGERDPGAVGGDPRVRRGDQASDVVGLHGPRR